MGSVPLAVARVAHLQWFFVNLYEAVVRMPERLADARADPAWPSGVWASGSPARYHIPAAPVVLGSTVAALVDGLRHGGDRPALLTASACSLSGVALTGYLVRTVNLKLLDGDAPVGPDERRALVDRWHRVNGVRLVALAAGSIALARAARVR